MYLLYGLYIYLVLFWYPALQIWASKRCPPKSPACRQSLWNPTLLCDVVRFDCPSSWHAHERELPHRETQVTRRNSQTRSLYQRMCRIRDVWDTCVIDISDVCKPCCHLLLDNSMHLVWIPGNFYSRHILIDFYQGKNVDLISSLLSMKRML